MADGRRIRHPQVALVSGTSSVLPFQCVENVTRKGGAWLRSSSLRDDIIPFPPVDLGDDPLAPAAPLQSTVAAAQ